MQGSSIIVPVMEEEEFKDFESAALARNRRDYSPFNAIIDRLRSQMDKQLADIDVQVFK